MDFIQESYGRGGKGWSKWRQVQHRLFGADRFVGIGWRVVAWADSTPSVIVFDMRAKGVESFRHYFRSGVPDEHKAFIAGYMPRWVYADWLEENIPEVPVEGLVMLRMQIETRLLG